MKHTIEIESKFNVLDEVDCTIALKRFSNVQIEIYKIAPKDIDDTFPFRHLIGTVCDIRFLENWRTFIYLVEFKGGERLWVAEWDMTTKEQGELNMKALATPRSLLKVVK